VGKKHGTAAAQARVRKLIKAGKLKKKCCKSKPRCQRCPVLALKKARKELAAA
jgi:hypothetical protein